MGHVFISYAREDKTTARAIQTGLERVGIPVWWDEKLQLREQFEPRIIEALESADSVLVLWSWSSVQSDWVQREAQIGLEQGTLLQILLDRDLALPDGFAALNGVDLSGWTPGRPNTEFSRLVQELLSMGSGVVRGEWDAQRLAPDTLSVALDAESHTLQYTGGQLYVDGQPAAASANPLDYDRSFDFDLSDGPERYVCRLVVRVSAFRGSVKRMTLSIGANVIYDA